jgi:hypothetical protein
MNNWIFINEGKIVEIVQKEEMYNPDDCVKPFDTVTEDPSVTFKIGDDFSPELHYQYNHTIFLNRGWILNLEPKTNLTTLRDQQKIDMAEKIKLSAGGLTCSNA